MAATERMSRGVGDFLKAIKATKPSTSAPDKPFSRPFLGIPVMENVLLPLVIHHQHTTIPMRTLRVINSRGVGKRRLRLPEELLREIHEVLELNEENQKCELRSLINRFSDGTPADSPHYVSDPSEVYTRTSAGQHWKQTMYFLAKERRAISDYLEQNLGVIVIYPQADSPLRVHLAIPCCTPRDYVIMNKSPRDRKTSCLPLRPQTFRLLWTRIAMATASGNQHQRIAKERLSCLERAFPKLGLHLDQVMYNLRPFVKLDSGIFMDAKPS